MTSTKFDVEKFTGLNDFGLWRIKMKALLVQQGLADAIKPESEFSKSVAEKKRAEMKEKAHSAIILCLSDKVLREVSKETTTAGVWTKLESLYMTKSLANRLYLKQRLYSYRILEDKSIVEQVDEFNKVLDDLENIDVKNDDEDKAIILLNSLTKSYDHLKDAMIYGRDGTITLDKVQSALKSKDLQKANDMNHNFVGESLNEKQKITKVGKSKKPPQDIKEPDQGEGKYSDTIEVEICKNKSGTDFQVEEQNEEQDTDVADLRNYLLARDRTRRNIAPPSRFNDSDMVYYALNVAENLEYHETGNYKEAINCNEISKHIDVKLHFARDEVDKGVVRMLKVSTEDNAADMLTKALPVAKFRYCIDLVGLSSH